MNKKIVFAVHAPTDSVEDGLVFGPGREQYHVYAYPGRPKTVAWNSI